MDTFNKNSLKSAVSKYGPLHSVDKKSEDDIKKELEEDERKFTDAQIAEIYNAIIDPSLLESADKTKVEKPFKHIVIAPFRDINNFSLEHKVGKDVSSFDPIRLAELVQNGLVEKVEQD